MAFKVDKILMFFRRIHYTCELYFQLFLISGLNLSFHYTMNLPNFQIVCHLIKLIELS